MDKISLNTPWFEYVKEGVKIYEGRRNTNKYQVGQYLLVSRRVNNIIDELTEPYIIVIQEILEFASFEEALIVLDISQVLPNVKSVEEGVEIYKKFVSLQTQERDGICMFKIKVVLV